MWGGFSGAGRYLSYENACLIGWLEMGGRQRVEVKKKLVVNKIK